MLYGELDRLKRHTSPLCIVGLVVVVEKSFTGSFCSTLKRKMQGLHGTSRIFRVDFPYVKIHMKRLTLNNVL